VDPDRVGDRRRSTRRDAPVVALQLRERGERRLHDVGDVARDGAFGELGAEHPGPADPRAILAVLVEADNAVPDHPPEVARPGNVERAELGRMALEDVLQIVGMGEEEDIRVQRRMYRWNPDRVAVARGGRRPPSPDPR
jgi:hypothetical protein